jgi:tetratricopeptide (TPR) repeat protein
MNKLALLSALIALPAFAQTLSQPPSGDNQRSTVTQQIGPATVSIEYSSPRVTRGENNRRGKIWGTLVPYGMTKNPGFGTCKECPWRAGANENTLFTATSDVKVQGQLLPAGKYGLHMVPGKDEFTVIFSKDTKAWGSFFYDPAHDQLRVNVKPVATPYREFLTYDFTNREPAKATVALEWEELAIPIEIAVDNAPALYVARMREELTGSTGFDWHNYQQAADYALRSKVAPEQALAWATTASDASQGGNENFGTLMTLSRAYAANGKADEAAKTQEKALNDPSAKPLDIHQAGRALLAEGKKDEAMKIFKLNAKRFPNQWPVHVGLMRGYAALGDNKSALAEAKLALAQAPDEGNKKSLAGMIERLEKGQNNIN